MVSVGRANFLSNDLTTTRFTNRDTPTHRHKHTHTHVREWCNSIKRRRHRRHTIATLVTADWCAVRSVVVPAVVDSRCHCINVCLFHLVCGVYWPRMLIIICTMAVLLIIYELDSL